MEKVQRHSLVVRLTHWIIALSGIILLFSGFMQLPMGKRYNIIKIPGLAWADNFEVTLLVHYISAAIFTAAVFFHLFYHMKRKEIGIIPRPGDLSGAAKGFLAMFGMGKEPVHGKFQAKQRVIYAIIGLTILVLVITGLIKSYKNLGAIVLEPLFSAGCGLHPHHCWYTVHDAFSCTRRSSDAEKSCYFQFCGRPRLLHF